MAVREPAGQLRQRIAIQSRSQTRTTQGGFTNVWATMSTVWASVEPVTGTEFTNDAKQNEQVTHKVRLRYYAGLDATMRFLYRGRYLNIVKVLNLDERKKIMEVDCIEVLPDGVVMLNESGLIMLDELGNSMMREGA